jgi:2-polyprenyl-3-methyl-5-hydroxy-6-metoxy-1,4-benzoquinol methylase
MSFIDTLPGRISPTFPNLQRRNEELDQFSDDILRRYLRDVRPHVNSAEFDDRFARATLFLLPYLSQVFTGRKLRALEVGCGQGAKAVALSQAFSEYVGVDIVPGVIREAKNFSDRFQLSNTRFEAVEAANLGSFLDKQPEKFDVIILYAVLEHLTIEEKLNLLNLCWEYLDPDGYIFIGEAPNRMVPTDYHSSKLLYFQGMPLDLWSRYYQRSPNESWKLALSAATDKAEFEHTAFRRGMHVGHQEFELGLPSVQNLSDHMISDNFAVEMLNLYPYTGIEFLTKCQHDQLTSFPPGVRLVPIELPPVFSRYYVETVLRKSPPPESRRRAFRVLAAGESGAYYNRKLAEGFRLGGGAEFVIPREALPDGDAATIETTVSFHRPAECGVVEVVAKDGDIVAEIDVPEAMRHISKWRANLSLTLPTIAADQFPVTLRSRSGPETVLSYVFMWR